MYGSTNANGNGDADAQSATGVGSDYMRPGADQGHSASGNSRTKPIMQTSGPAFGGAPLEDAGMMMGGGAQTRANNSSMNVNQA